MADIDWQEYGFDDSMEPYEMGIYRLHYFSEKERLKVLYIVRLGPPKGTIRRTTRRSNLDHTG